ncbi:hypothetical protein ACTMU2_14055 [Cupriavidus basilensis]
MTYYLYVLKLVGGRYYIGMTAGPPARTVLTSMAPDTGLHGPGSTHLSHWSKPATPERETER